MNHFDQARDLLVQHMRAVHKRHNVPRLNHDADVVESGEEWNFWMEAAHAAVAEALAATGKQSLQVGEKQIGDTTRMVGEAQESRGQFEAWVETHVVGYTERNAAGGYRSGTVQAAWDAWQAALASRQPVGEIVAWFWPSTGVVCSAEAVKRDRAPTDNATPLYAAPSARGIDLGQFRGAVSDAEDFIARHSWAWNGRGAHPNGVHRNLKELLALLDGRDAGKGVSHG